MFTREQIEKAHSRVKSGADFPAYVQEIKALGVKNHIVSLLDGVWRFIHLDGGSIQWVHGPKELPVSAVATSQAFRRILSNHQHGLTDYPTFCQEAAQAGVEKWISDFESMTVTYLDRQGGIVSVEAIGQ